MTQPFLGVFTALATPFLANGQLDILAFQRLLFLQKSAGVQGIVVGGTTGESPTLSAGELDVLVSHALEFQSPQFSVYVGVGSNSTAQALETTQRFLGPQSPHGKTVDGFMAVVPYYNKPTQEGLMAHFGAIAQKAGQLPLCLYNVPGRTGCHLDPETAAILCSEHSNIVAIKEASGDLKTFTFFSLALESRGLAKKVKLLSGDDPTWAMSLACGGSGVISVTSHLIPRAMVTIWKASCEGHWSGVHQGHKELFDFHNALFVAPNPIPLKFILSYLNLCGPTLRLPLTPLPKSLEPMVLKAFHNAQNQGWAITPRDIEEVGHAIAGH